MMRTHGVIYSIHDEAFNVHTAAPMSTTQCPEQTDAATVHPLPKQGALVYIVTNVRVFPDAGVQHAGRRRL